MKSKWFKYIAVGFFDTFIGVINAESQEEAKLLLQENYKKEKVNGDIILEEISLEEGFCEIYKD